MPEIPQLKKYKVNLHLLTPLHVGTGQEMDPFSYVIKDNRLYFIDLLKWMDAFPDKTVLNRVMESDSFAEVRTFIAQNIKAEDFALASVPVDCPGLIGTYNHAIEKKDAHNQVLISPMIRNDVSMSPYLPGSSIKGSIRTAIASAFVKDAGVTADDVRRHKSTQPPYNIPDYNEKIFGRIKDDPLKFLKIPDIPFESTASLIMEAKEISMSTGKTPTPKGYIEVLKGLSYAKQPVVKDFLFSLAPFHLPVPLKKRNVDVAFIIEALYDFYVPKFWEEHEKFYSAAEHVEIGDLLSPVNHIIRNMKTNETLLRIGHYSHVECITLDDVRRPMTRRGKDGKPLPYGTTRTLANGLHPFGWVKMEFCDIAGEIRKPISGREGSEKPITETGTSATATAGRRRIIVSESGKKAVPADLSKLSDKFRVKGKINE